MRSEHSAVPDVSVAARPSRVMSFGESQLQPVSAHDGAGHVLASREIDRGDAPGLRFVDLVDVPVGATIGRHTHGHDEELYVVLSGQAVVELDGERITIRAGDVVVNRPGGTHALEVVGQTPVRLVVVCTGP